MKTTMGCLNLLLELDEVESFTLRVLVSTHVGVSMDHESQFLTVGCK